MTIISHSFTSSSESETCKIATLIAGQCSLEDCILLKGDLGAGKTVFARGFIQGLCQEKEVVSPTFTLVQIYESAKGRLWHFDLYRLKSAQELQEIGLEEALANGISLIEWPELAETLLPKTALTVHLKGDSNKRQITLSGVSEIWQSRFHAIATIVTQ